VVFFVQDSIKYIQFLTTSGTIGPEICSGYVCKNIVVKKITDQYLLFQCFQSTQYQSSPHDLEYIDMYFDDGILSTQQDFDPDFAINNQNIRANVSDVIHIL
jgi:hypothetical protein